MRARGRHHAHVLQCNTLPLTCLLPLWRAPEASSVCYHATKYHSYGFPFQRSASIRCFAAFDGKCSAIQGQRTIVLQCRVVALAKLVRGLYVVDQVHGCGTAARGSPVQVLRGRCASQRHLSGIGQPGPCLHAYPHPHPLDCAAPASFATLPPIFCVWWSFVGPSSLKRRSHIPWARCTHCARCTVGRSTGYSVGYVKGRQAQRKWEKHSQG